MMTDYDDPSAASKASNASLIGGAVIGAALLGIAVARAGPGFPALEIPISATIGGFLGAVVGLGVGGVIDAVAGAVS